MKFSNSCNCQTPEFVFDNKVWSCKSCNTEMRVSVCREGCKTQDHETYWECLHSANILIDKSSLRA